MRRGRPNRPTTPSKTALIPPTVEAGRPGTVMAPNGFGSHPLRHLRRAQVEARIAVAKSPAQYESDQRLGETTTAWDTDRQLGEIATSEKS